MGSWGARGIRNPLEMGLDLWREHLSLAEYSQAEIVCLLLMYRQIRSMAGDPINMDR